MYLLGKFNLWPMERSSAGRINVFLIYVSENFYLFQGRTLLYCFYSKFIAILRKTNLL